MRGNGRALRFTLLLPLIVGACATPSLPVEEGVSSPFGMRWIGILPGIHRGTDFGAPDGTPVRAMAAGRVRFAGVMEGYGNVVWIDHPGGVITVYAHLSRMDVSAGREVSRRKVVGLSGSTGSTTGPNLHFEVWKGGRPVDPLQYLGKRP
ncbi:MAG: M23 family metallopeptidase [Gemmatimonadetes bacterium]|nr:M23 family metallopeptidase [Gemmatimonadota bacterium]